MALGSKTCRGQRHGLGTGGEQVTEGRGEQKGLTGEAVNGQGTAKGESDRDEEGKREGKRKGNRWWGALNSTGSSTKEEVPIIFSTYNIRSGRNGGLDSALRGMSQANMDLGIFQECLLQSSVPPVPDVVSAESNRHFLLRRTPGTIKRSPPTVAFFLP